MVNVEVDQASLQMPLVSYRGLQKSGRLLKFVLDYYFPLYELGLDDFFACQPALSMFSALLQQLDVDIERLQAESRFADSGPVGRKAFATIESVLRALDLLDARTAAEIDALTEYVRLETKIVAAPGFTLAELRCALELRSADLRMMHKMVLRLSNRTYDPLLFELCVPLEVIAEIRDDLYQYRDDRASGSFNTYVLLEQLYQDDEAPERLMQQYRHYQGRFFESLQRAPAKLQQRLEPIATIAFDLATFPCPPGDDQAAASPH